VDPAHVQFDGLPCAPTVAAIREPIDLAVIALPAASVVEALGQCVAVGARATVVSMAGSLNWGRAVTANSIVWPTSRGPVARGFWDKIV
jgi:acyl-CoA synthetase (NDP forming)